MARKNPRRIKRKLRKYRVRQGDNYFTISRRLFGTDNYAGVLAEMNQGVSLSAGMVIKTNVGNRAPVFGSAVSAVFGMSPTGIPGEEFSKDAADRISLRAFGRLPFSYGGEGGATTGGATAGGTAGGAVASRLAAAGFAGDPATEEYVLNTLASIDEEKKIGYRDTGVNIRQQKTLTEQDIYDIVSGRGRTEKTGTRTERALDELGEEKQIGYTDPELPALREVYEPGTREYMVDLLGNGLSYGADIPAFGINKAFSSGADISASIVNEVFNLTPGNAAAAPDIVGNEYQDLITKYALKSFSDATSSPDPTMFFQTIPRVVTIETANEIFEQQGKILSSYIEQQTKISVVYETPEQLMVLGLGYELKYDGHTNRAFYERPFTQIDTSSSNYSGGGLGGSTTEFFRSGATFYNAPRGKRSQLPNAPISNSGGIVYAPGLTQLRIEF